MITLGDIGENALLRKILPRLPQRADTLVGPGDDCAVVRVPGSKDDLLLTTDPVIEHRHFRPDTPPRLIGRKAIARVVSDIAAMGGTPQWLLINLVAPASTPVARIHHIYDGMIAAAKKWNLAILGGDTAEGPALELHITGIGRIPRNTAILRSGARPRDTLFVTGTLGGAYHNNNRHHLTFEPRIQAGQFLAQHKLATSMMDISDGLATDLPRLLDASKRGVSLDASAIPISRAARKTPNPLHHALCDGEDFELLFTISPKNIARFTTTWKRKFPRLPATPIGTILADPTHRTHLSPGGYQHFAPIQGSSPIDT